MSLCNLSPSVPSFQSHLPDHRREEKEATGVWSPEGQGAGLATLLVEDHPLGFLFCKIILDDALLEVPEAGG